LRYEDSRQIDRQNHHHHYYRRQKAMKDLIEKTGELIKAILKIVLLGDEPEQSVNDQEKASQ
jgi:hypothetical protein